MARSSTLAVALLFLSASLAGCSSQRRLPNVVVTIAPVLPAQQIIVLYQLKGSFGTYAQRDFIQSTQTRYLIKAGAAGKSADHALIYLWTQGCELATFDVDIGWSSDLITRTFVCKPLPKAVLKGQVQAAALVKKRAVEIEVAYWPDWQCNTFAFGLQRGPFAPINCEYGPMLVGEGKVDSRGAFEVELSGLSPGPIRDSFLQRDTLEFSLYDSKTGDSLDVRPASGPIYVASAYPQPVVLVPRKRAP